MYNLGLNNNELRQLCIKNNWFTDGSSSQYDKMFQVNSEGRSIDELATIIWCCSEQWSKRDIRRELFSNIFIPNRSGLSSVSERAELVQAMHTIICNMNNEDAYESWINIVPDEPCLSDFFDIAEDDELFDCCVTRFNTIMQEYLDDGFCI